MLGEGPDDGWRRARETHRRAHSGLLFHWRFCYKGAHGDEDDKSIKFAAPHSTAPPSPEARPQQRGRAVLKLKDNLKQTVVQPPSPASFGERCEVTQSLGLVRSCCEPERVRLRLCLRLCRAKITRLDLSARRACRVGPRARVWARKDTAVERDKEISLPQFDIVQTVQKYRLEELSSGESPSGLQLFLLLLVCCQASLVIAFRARGTPAAGLTDWSVQGRPLINWALLSRLVCLPTCLATKIFW
ncbi:Hypothetical predicted protein [Olea europaea subsp. europaea]|uniref:Uncharacterized protein n=1 Tax=Olea europaea subsp. europaea TaxID=158383 RepID=A0A8S0TMA7_OLEEU|nr:Hypothetical predicted protein [Olea europaea subsp. europaea]